MLDLKYLRDNLDEAIERLNTRGDDFTYLRDVVKHDERRRAVIRRVETLKKERNETSKKIGQFKREGKDPSAIFQSIEDNKKEIAELEKELGAIEKTIEDTLLRTPNLPYKGIPIGKDDTENPVLRHVGEIPEFTFEPKAHWDLGIDLDILDFKRAVKVAASRFTIYKGLGSRLERALINFMLDMHVDEHGYDEVLLPFIVNKASMQATGQLPKFKDDAFELNDERGLYLNPTAEVPGINMHRDEILAKEALPKRYVAFTTAFRQEAGSAGRDTRGIIRQHQFNKVELIKFTTPETSYQALETMLENSENILKALKLPYRVVEICSGDLGFSMAKTYDLEVYLPSYETYREIGSISNAEDYQARRGNIKYRPEKGAKPEFLHTLNGSGLAVGRTVVAIMENYQQEDGSIVVPEVLRPYLKTDRIQSKKEV
ncbi:MAG: serine--tRNA ligase [Bacillota bacterium]